MMKKTISLLLSMMLVMSLFACGNEEAPKEEADENVFAKYEEANDVKLLLEKYGDIAVEVTNYDSEGSSAETEIHKAKDKILYIYDGLTAVFEDEGKTYEYSDDLSQIAEAIYAGDSYDVYAKPYLDFSLCNFNKGKEIADEEIKENGEIILKTHTSAEDEADALENVFGFDPEDVEMMVFELHFDEETLLMKSSHSFVKTKAGDLVKVEDAFVAMTEEEYPIPEEVTNEIHKEETKTLKLVGEGEDVFTYEVGEGVALMIYPPLSYEDTIYADADFTKTVPEEKAEEVDRVVTMYLKKLAE